MEQSGDRAFADLLEAAPDAMVCVDGYQVLAAANGPEALAILDRHQGPVQVLLTDVVMPQMPGKQLADKVRAGWPGIQVLFMSGYTQGLLSAQGVLERDVHLIEKPFDRQPCSPS